MALRKAAFVLRLWHRFVPFLPQPAEDWKKQDLLLRSGRFAQRVMVGRCRLTLCSPC